MGFLKFFQKEDTNIESYPDFWRWFQQHEKRFYKAVQKADNIEGDFFDELSEALDQLNRGYYFLAGMVDDETAELIFTVDGNINNLVFVEEIVAEAPQVPGWKFTAHKQAMDISGMQIEMEGYEFNEENLRFYSNEHPQQPDCIDIVAVYDHFKEEDAEAIFRGLCIYIDNLIGELNAVTLIDRLSVVSPAVAEKEAIPMAKLAGYLVWREKEFIEKYEATRFNTVDENYSLMEGQLENGHPLLVVMNSDLLQWDAKMSHPWIMGIEINYSGNESNGLPDDVTYHSMNELEEELMQILKDSEGYLNVLRKTGDNERVIFFACKDFRKPAKVLYEISAKYANLDITYDIFKDKYWESLSYFSSSTNIKPI